MNSESRDISQKNILKYNNPLSSKTSSSGTITKVSNKEKSDNNSQQDDDVDSYSSSQKENSHKNYPSFFDEDFNDEMKCINCNIF